MLQATEVRLQPDFLFCFVLPIFPVLLSPCHYFRCLPAVDFLHLPMLPVRLHLQSCFSALHLLWLLHSLFALCCFWRHLLSFLKHSMTEVRMFLLSGCLPEVTGFQVDFLRNRFLMRQFYFRWFHLYGFPVCRFQYQCDCRNCRYPLFLLHFFYPV